MKTNNKSLYIFSFKLVLIVILIYALVRYFIFPFVPFLAHEKKYRYELSNLDEIHLKESDIAFFGNSLVYTAYDPSLITNRLGVNAYHFNSSSQVLESSLIAARYVIEKKPFEYVVFDVSKGSLIRPKAEKEKSWYFQSVALQAIPLSFDKYEKVNAFFPKEKYFEYYMNALSSSFGKAFLFNEREKFDSDNIGPDEYYHFRGALFSEKGYFAYDFNKKSIPKKTFDSEFYKEASSRISTDKLWNENLKQQLEDFIAFAETEGTEVILINSLKLREENYNSDFIEGLKKQFKTLKFINLNSEREKYHLTNLSFFDGSHLTYLGSYEVTNRLIDSISSWNKNLEPYATPFNFKECNLKRSYFNFVKGRDSYIKLEFDSIPKKLRTYNLVLSLYPNDPSLLSNESIKKGLKFDEFQFKDIKKGLIKTKYSEIFIKRLTSKISEQGLDSIVLKFQKENDTLKMPSFTITSDEIRNYF